MKVAVVDDNAMIRQLLVDYFKSDDNIDVVASLEDGAKCLEYINTEQPDVLILDMLMPEKDGMAVLEELKNMDLLKKKIRCIVLTAIGDEAMSKKVFELGVDYVMLKPFNLDDLRRRLYEIDGIVDENEASKLLQMSTTEDNLERRITTILNEVGFTPNLKGYKYLKSAIRIAYNDQETLNGITKQLYPKIAKENQTYYSQVERTIRSAIEIAWDKSQGNFFYKILGYRGMSSGKRPTNGEFIASVVEYLK